MTRTTRKRRAEQAQARKKKVAKRGKAIRMAGAAAPGPQAGDVILFHGDSIVSRLIRLFDGTDWNHCGHLLGPDLLAEIDAGVPVGTKSLKTKLQAYGAPGTIYAGVFRLKTAEDGTLTDMQPLIASTNAIIADAPSYGYDAIILLFLLSISKKLPVVPLWARALITLVGKRAAGLLLDLEGQNKVPLICSAFTHWSFSSVTTNQANFAIDIPSSRAAVARATAAIRRMGPAGVLMPESGSILAQHMRTRSARSVPSFRAPHLPPTSIPSEAEIDAAGEAFLKKAKRRTAGKARVQAPTAVLENNEELSRAIETVLQFFPAVAPGMRGAAVPGTERLISPGDLSESPSLDQIGRLASDGTFTPS